MKRLLSWPVVLAFLLLGVLVFLCKCEPSWNVLWSVLALLLVGFIVVIFLRKPTHDRNWGLPWKELPRAEVDGDRIVIQNFRAFEWTSLTDFDPKWEERTFDLSNLRRMDLIVNPFKPSSPLAHVMIGFDFGDEGWLMISPEARREESEPYGIIKGALRQFELIYLVGGAEDFILDRAVMRETPVFSFPVLSTEEFRRELLLNLLDTVNGIYEKPEFYNSFRRNCTTVLVDHIDRLRPNEPAIGLRIGTLLPTKAGKLLHGYGYMDTELDYDAAQEAFRIDVEWRNRHVESGLV